MCVTGGLSPSEVVRLLDSVAAELAVLSQIRLEACSGAGRAAAGLEFERGCSDALADRPLRRDADLSQSYRNGFMAGRGLRTEGKLRQEGV